MRAFGADDRAAQGGSESNMLVTSAPVGRSQYKSGPSHAVMRRILSRYVVALIFHHRASGRVTFSRLTPTTLSEMLFADFCEAIPTSRGRY
jgi:hypothetical protein